jgi:hypothetical protein
MAVVRGRRSSYVFPHRRRSAGPALPGRRRPSPPLPALPALVPLPAVSPSSGFLCVTRDTHTKEAREREGAPKRDKREEGHGPATADGDLKGDRRTGDGDRKE